jgi:hypothetical protein
MLPPPVDDMPEAWGRRDCAARAKVASLVPVSPIEADLAVHHVAAMAQAAECLGQLGEVITDRKEAARLRSQAASMGREARGYLSKLQSVQRVRMRREADDGGRDSAHLSEHCLLGTLTDAMAQLPAKPPVRQMEPEPPPAPSTARAAASAPPVKLRVLRDYNDWSDEEKRVDRLRWEVDRYAILKTRHAKLIRQLGGLPPNCDFEPPRDEVLQQLIRRTDSNITWVDTWEPWVHPDLRVPPG